MTNAQRFKTPEEQAREYERYCKSHGMGCSKCPLRKVASTRCHFEWLFLEYKEELKPCPFCGEEARIVDARSSGVTYYFVECKTCFGKTVSHLKQEDAVAAWNRRAT